MSKMTDQERHVLLTEARQFTVAAPAILPLLDKMERMAYEKLLAKYRDGDTETGSLLGELFVLNNLKREFKIKEEIFTTLQEKF